MEDLNRLQDALVTTLERVEHMRLVNSSLGEDVIVLKKQLEKAELCVNMGAKGAWNTSFECKRYLKEKENTLVDILTEGVEVVENDAPGIIL